MLQWDENELTLKACASDQTRTANGTSAGPRQKLCLYKSKICQSLMTENNKDVILGTIPRGLLSCQHMIRKSFPRLI